MMDVRTARTWAEGAQLALQKNKTDQSTFAPEALPQLVEALAVLGRQEYQMRCQLNATKTRLQALQQEQRATPSAR